jgi:hypothetical protein
MQCSKCLKMNRLLLVSLLFVACKKNDSPNSGTTGTYYFKFQTDSITANYEPTLQQLDTAVINGNTSDYAFGVNSTDGAAISVRNLDNKTAPFNGGFTTPSILAIGNNPINFFSMVVQVGNNAITYSTDTSITLNITSLTPANNTSILLSGIITGTFSGTVRQQISYGDNFITDPGYMNDYDYSYYGAPIVHISGSFSLPQ